MRIFLLLLSVSVCQAIQFSTTVVNPTNVVEVTNNVPVTNTINNYFTNTIAGLTNNLYQNANLLQLPVDFQSPPGEGQTTNSWITNWLSRVTSTDLVLVVRTTKASGVNHQPLTFNFSSVSGAATALPLTNKIVVVVNGTVTNPVLYDDFKQYVEYQADQHYSPYVIIQKLQLGLLTAITNGAQVTVTDTDGTVLTNVPYAFSRTFASDDFNWAIQVNQEGYYPGWDKRATVSYWSGTNKMEVAWPVGTAFNVWNLDGSSNQYNGFLSNSVDTGWSAATPPSQKVMYADFSAVTLPGYYYIMISNQGRSLPFFIDPAYPLRLAQYAAKGLYGQQCGVAVTNPFVSLTHSACHTGVAIPLTNTTTQAALFTEVNAVAANVGAIGNWNFNQYMTNSAAACTGLWAFVRTTNVVMGSGYHDAGDYSQYVPSQSEVVSRLATAAGSYTGVKLLDNLGIPYSGDGIPDFYQMAKNEADSLLWKQDTDGGVSAVAYPFPSFPYENVVPGDTTNRFLFPKDVLATWAAVGAWADLAADPTFKQYYPAQASVYLTAATNGWAWATQAVANAGYTNSYRPSHFYGYEFGPEDEMIYAATALFIATSNTTVMNFGTNKVATLFGSQTRKSWQWWPEWESYGSAQRVVAFSVKSGKVSSAFWTPYQSYFNSATNEIITVAAIVEDWATNNAFGTPFQANSKPGFTTPYYFGNQHIQCVIQGRELKLYYGQAVTSNSLAVIVRCENFEAGCNPANKARWAGLGQNPIKSSPSQWDRYDDKVGPPTGFPMGSLSQGISGGNYGNENLQVLIPHADNDNQKTSFNPYEQIVQDGFNVNNQEPVSPRFVDNLCAAAYLAGLTVAYQPTPQIILQSAPTFGTAQDVSVVVPGFDLAKAKIVWNSVSNALYQGTTYSWTPRAKGQNWIKAEVWLAGNAYATALSTNVP